MFTKQGHYKVRLLGSRINFCEIRLRIFDWFLTVILNLRLISVQSLIYEIYQLEYFGRLSLY